jgi:hypothetical protein
MALGGSDINGYIDKNYIIKLIKNEFELEFNLTDFIEDLDLI